jgi:hypothetical protein
LGKGAYTFKQTDVTRALKAAKKAGVDVQVTIDLERKRLTITPIKAGGENGTNEWDEVFDNGDDQASVR